MDARQTGVAGSLGPRLAGRLTAELVLRSPQYMNCVKEYEIDMRGHKIGQIENLGTTENQFDSMDLSDNAIIILDGFPKLARLKTLLLSNNRITRIGRGLEVQIPDLRILNLANNRLRNLRDLDPLATLPHLQNLSLLENEVCKLPNYRQYALHRCVHLTVLDFRKVKLKEREAAKELPGASTAADKTFEPGEGMAEAGAAPTGDQAMTDGAATAGAPAEMSAAQRTAVQAAIANAATLEEVSRLEAALATGQLPSGVQAENANGPSTAAPMDES